MFITPSYSKENYKDIKKVPSSIISGFYTVGYSTTDIAHFLNCSNQSIYARLKKHKTKIRNYKEAYLLRLKHGKKPLPTFKCGSQHPSWKNGKTTDKNGYVLLRVDNKYMPEHRYIWEQERGGIPKGWIIHHLNGEKLDNRIENLAMMPRKDHSPKKIIEPFRTRIRELEKELNHLHKILKKRV